jgi:hypothetical protein
LDLISTDSGSGFQPRFLCCVSFEGGGGYVVITVAEEQKMKRVDVETREFNNQAKRSWNYFQL